MKPEAMANRFRIWQQARKGLSTNEIASVLQLSPETVRVHKKELNLRKGAALAPARARMTVTDYMRRNGDSFFIGGPE